MRSLRMGPLLVAVAVCVLFALFGTALIGESLGNWYGALDKPWFLIPQWAFGIVGAAYYVSSPPSCTASLFTLTTPEEELPRWR